MKSLGDERTRDRIQHDLDTSFVVEASAGTGKTSALVSRMVSVLRAGKASLNGMVAVTFTDKAAGEMKLRLRSEIERFRMSSKATPAERKHLDQALSQLETARIGTIHSLCADFLHEWPVESGIDPLFEMVAQEEGAALFDAAFNDWFSRVLEDPPEGVRRLLRRRPRRPNDETARDQLQRAAYGLAQRPDFDADWERPPFEREFAIDAMIERIREVGGIASLTKDTGWLAQNLQEFAKFTYEIDHRESVRERDYDGLEEELRVLHKTAHWRWKGGRASAPGMSKDQILARRDELKRDLEMFLERADADLAACLQHDLRSVVREYQTLRDRSGKLDFTDLLLQARDLLRDNENVRAAMQARFTHLFVDEFQDTDPLQAEILLLLAANNSNVVDWQEATPVQGKLFVVGDPKQSIYRFRRADVAVYESVKQRLLDKGAELLYLRSSFRATKEIHDIVNAAFEPVMQGGADGAQAAYVALESVRENVPNQPSLVALPIPRPYSEYGKVTKYAIDASAPDAVGAYVDWLIQKSGWTVTDRERPDERVPIQPRHICLLFKRFAAFGTDTTRGYVRALEARRIPHVLVGGRSFHAREEVLALRNVLDAIEWPDDELAVFATLRGPFFAFADDQLLAFRAAFGRFHPLRKIEDERLNNETREVTEALRVLAKLHAGRNRRPVADTVERFLDAVRAHAGIGIWPTGEQALANVLRVLDMARRYESGGGATSFRGFVDWLARDADRGESAEAAVVEEGTEGVRIMTVHRAKGLEFPVVILCDPSATRSNDKPSRYVDAEKRAWYEPIAGLVPAELVKHRDDVLRRDDAEAVRVVYVAATRARDLLVVPVCGDERTESWYDTLYQVVYPAQASARRAEQPQGLPTFSEDSVFEVPKGTDRTLSRNVMPGWHKAELGSHRVLWWDPRQLELDKQHGVGLRQEKLLTVDEKGVVSADYTRAHDEWAARREKLLVDGALPSVKTITVTESARASSRTSQVNVARVAEITRGRPKGPRFGALVHSVLALVPFGADEQQVASLAASQARLLGAPIAERDACAVAVKRVLDHELMRRAAEAEARGECRREVPVTWRGAGDVILEGVADLAYKANGAWLVVDFKTDAEVETRVDAYARQVALYAEGIALATGETASGVLLVL